ncbi:MAG: YwaF family protein, partial [Clostridiales bacterium]|nr:YwaF family protein [Clostridiales bacterium]
THTLLVLIPLTYYVREKIHVSFKHFWYPYAFLGVVTPLIYILDKKTNTNYMFLSYPVAHSPLSLTRDIFGKERYILGLVVLVTIALLFEYTLYTVLELLRKKKPTDS